MNTTELKILLRAGRDRAKKSSELAAVCHSSDREVRLAIRDLIADGLPVASSTDRMAGGYFIAETLEEVEGYIAEMRSRVIQDCLRIRDFKRAARPILNPCQRQLL